MVNPGLYSEPRRTPRENRRLFSRLRADNGSGGNAYGLGWPTRICDKKTAWLTTFKRRFPAKNAKGKSKWVKFPWTMKRAREYCKTRQYILCDDKLTLMMALIWPLNYLSPKKVEKTTTTTTKKKQWGVPFSKSCLIKVTVASTTENRNCLYPKSQLKNDFHKNICPEEGHFLKEGQNKIKRDKTTTTKKYKNNKMNKREDRKVQI